MSRSLAESFLCVCVCFLCVCVCVCVFYEQEFGRVLPYKIMMIKCVCVCVRVCVCVCMSRSLGHVNGGPPCIFYYIRGPPYIYIIYLHTYHLIVIFSLTVSLGLAHMRGARADICLCIYIYIGLWGLGTWEARAVLLMCC